MAKAVKTEDLARAIISYSLEELQKNKSWRYSQIPYSFNDFKKAVLSRELILDPRTIRAKWDLIVAKGIVSEIGGGKALLSIPALERTAGIAVPKVETQTQTDTDTHIQEASE